MRAVVRVRLDKLHRMTWNNTIVIERIEQVVKTNRLQLCNCIISITAE